MVHAQRFLHLCLCVVGWNGMHFIGRSAGPEISLWSTPGFSHHESLSSSRKAFLITKAFPHHESLSSSRKPFLITKAFPHHESLSSSRKPFLITKAFPHHESLSSSRTKSGNTKPGKPKWAETAFRGFAIRVFRDE